MSNNLKIYCVTDKPLKKLENSNLNLAGVGKAIIKSMGSKAKNRLEESIKETF